MVTKKARRRGGHGGESHRTAESRKEDGGDGSGGAKECVHTLPPVGQKSVLIILTFV